ncbi:MAG: heme-binding protein [Nevskiaceae bacterium]
MSKKRFVSLRETVFSAGLALALAACSGGDGGIGGGGCTGFCADTPTRLTVADVEQVIAQAVAEAGARGASATIAVVDRTGNVLGVFRMNGADPSLATDGGRGVSGGLDNVGVVPSALGAIAKAVTGAYLSSEGNAFTSRTASQIVQQHFYPGEFGQPSGPLFGVQFSQLPCSDLNARFDGITRPSPGPHRSPLGLAADPGGLPLYKGGTVVGGIGVLADGIYGVDRDIRDRDVDDDEVIALAGAFGFEAPADRRADRITVDGKALRFVDAAAADLAADPAAAPAFAAIVGVAGTLVAVPGYAGAAIVAGTAFGQPESGVRPAPGALAALDAFVLVDDTDTERFAPSAATDASVTGPDALTAAEAEQLLASALAVANRTRAQIRRPLGTPARVSVSVVDSFGAALGVARTRDAPIFGIDVSLQKARTAAFMSNVGAAADLAATPDTTYLGSGDTASIAGYVPALRAFLGRPTALADGAVAFSAKATANLARPYFPDGLAGGAHGPLAQPIAAWSVFSTGLQLDLLNSAVIRHVTFVLGGGTDVPAGECTGLPATANGANRLANGTQIFSGGVPIYRGATLVGAIGVSGDGVDQDDMISFLGLHEAGLALGTGLGNAPAAMRADTLTPFGVRLRYVQCPQSPYYASSEQNVCEGK